MQSVDIEIHNIVSFPYIFHTSRRTNPAEMALTNGQLFDCLCRSCMQVVELSQIEANSNTGQKWKSISDTIEEFGAMRIAQLISSTIPHIVEVNLTDQLPKKICSECLQQLLSVYRFQRMCIQSDQKMRELITERNELKAEQTKLKAEQTNQKSHMEASGETIEFEPVSTLQQSKAETADDPLQNIDVVMECSQDFQDDLIIKKEPCIVNETITEYSHGESLHSIVTVKNEELTPEKVEEEVKSGVSTHACSLCNKSFEKLRYLKCHMKRHQKIGEQSNMPAQSHACYLCNKSFEKSRYLKVHLKRHETIGEQQPKMSEQSQEKGEPYRFKCDICDRYFQKPESLHSHRLAHADKQVIGKACNICNKIYSTRFTLARHKRIYHSTEKSKKTLKQYICEFCNNNFKNSVALKIHVRKHTGERPYLCPECGKSFGQAGGLRDHILRHGDEKSFECPYCPLKFRCPSDVCKHKLIHEGIKRHVCDLCGESFGKSNQLVVHKRIHNNEKPYKCDYCEMCFVRKGSQLVHMRTHTGEKPYKCNYCERAFAQKGDHTKHLRTHVGDNIYRCQLCPLAFRLASEMRSHFMKHKNEDPETRERNIKALKEEEAKFQLKMAEKDTTTVNALA